MSTFDHSPDVIVATVAAGRPLQRSYASSAATVSAPSGRPAATSPTRLIVSAKVPS